MNWWYWKLFIIPLILCSVRCPKHSSGTSGCNSNTLWRNISSPYGRKCFSSGKVHCISLVLYVSWSLVFDLRRMKSTLKWVFLQQLSLQNDFRGLKLFFFFFCWQLHLKSRQNWVCRSLGEAELLLYSRWAVISRTRQVDTGTSYHIGQYMN